MLSKHSCFLGHIFVQCWISIWHFWSASEMWRAVEEGAMEGKLLCAHCEARLGYFNWSGIQCSCGSWITPAFQLHKSRVDISSMWNFMIGKAPTQIETFRRFWHFTLSNTQCLTYSWKYVGNLLYIKTKLIWLQFW